MGQRPALLLLVFLLNTLIGAIGCDRSSSSASWPASAAPRPGTVASLVPAATEMLLGMDAAAGHLVAVSHFDTPRDGTRDLPRVGEYQTTDWERLASHG